ncbi:hypothetical protein DFH09DRAFT_1368531 [Mycena vulgaris]|nr:hypothetical protein DFH09DRAFT_1368531 [Mycena vulgaris]
MRDIDNQNGGDQEGFHGPYALWFTTGAAPSAALNTTFWATLGTISGFVAEAGRGRVTGKASNFRSAHSTLLSIGWSNSADSAGNFLPTTIWTIGDYDGTPRGFLNADKIETMHSTRMSS